MEHNCKGELRYARPFELSRKSVRPFRNAKLVKLTKELLHDASVPKFSAVVWDYGCPRDCLPCLALLNRLVGQGVSAESA
jgi:hypothetical protein